MTMMTPSLPRMFGNQNSSGPSQERNNVCTGPVKSNKPRVTNAMTYAGMASGNNRPQEKIFRPGNSHTAVNQAKLTPSSAEPTATPRVSQNVFINNLGKMVSTKCCQTSPVGVRNDKRTVPTGISTSTATRTGMKRQLSIVRKK